MVEVPLSQTGEGPGSAMTSGNKCMEVDVSDESSCHTTSKALVPVPVVAGSSGEGLPYAPEGWPCPGDVWRWKVGIRNNSSGYWKDRYLYPPVRLHKNGSKIFPSRQSLEEYIRKEFPEADFNAFFSSFIWKIPSANCIQGKGRKKTIHSIRSRRSLDANAHCGSMPTIRAGECKAGNKMCTVKLKAKKNGLAAKACDICCSEADFCHDCCCILCCRVIDWAYGGYSFIRCEAALDEKHICGHVAHIDCALRTYMAGTVGGSIGLDVEYYCRRCDNKTDLTLHVTKLIDICESCDSQEAVAKILSLGLCILRGSEQSKARDLRNRIRHLLTKLRDGVCIDETWKLEDSVSAFIEGDASHLEIGAPQLDAAGIKCNKSTNYFACEIESSDGNKLFDEKTQRLYITADHSNVSVKLEDEIDQVLNELKKAQESEYMIAEQKLYAQKDFLLSLYQQLDAERSELAKPTSLPSNSNQNANLSNVLNRVDQIKHEESKLRNMMKIAKGFGQTPKSVLIEHFKLPSNE